MTIFTELYERTSISSITEQKVQKRSSSSKSISSFKRLHSTQRQTENSGRASTYSSRTSEYNSDAKWTSLDSIESLS